MGQLKASEVDLYLGKPLGDIKLFLVYGPDTGLVSERADLLAKKTGIDLKDSFASIRLDADEAASDRARISDEANTVSMFGGQRLLRVSGTTRKDLAKAIEPVLADPPPDTWLIVEAGDLKKTVGLRKQFEKATSALAVPCYQDSVAALNQLISDEVEAQGLALDNNTRTFLRERLGADRKASRNELQKLALYVMGASSVTIDDVKAIVGDASQTITDDLFDAVATGDIAGFESNYQEVVSSGTSPDQLLVFALRHFQLLHQARAMMEKSRQSAVAAVGGIRPPVHFSRKDKVVQALSNWTVSRLNKATARLHDASYQCRKNQGIGTALASTTLLAIALEAKIARSN